MRRWLPLITICLGTLMLMIDVTIVNVALPAMASDLHTSFGALQWVIDAYALALAALLLAAGSIGDLLGHRRSHLAGLLLFGLSSLGCGIAPTAGLLVTARAVQGTAAAAMFATTFALINSCYHGRERGTAYGLWGGVAGAASALGPVLGGLLTDTGSWRWVFFVNVPVSLAAIALCLSVLPRGDTAGAGRLDLPGAITFSGFAAALTYGLIRANETGLGSPAAWGWFVAAPVLLAAFVAVEARSPQPMLDLAVLRNRTLIAVLTAAMLLTFAAFGSYLYTSLWLQSVLRLSPLGAGLTAVPLSVCAFGVAVGSGRLVHAAPPAAMIGGGLALIGAGGLLCAAMLHGDAGWTALLPGLMITGVGVGLATPTIAATATAAVSLQRAGMAGGAVNTMRQLGFATSVALLGAVFAGRAATLLTAHHAPRPEDISAALASGQAPHLIAAAPIASRGALAADLHTAATGALQSVFLTCGTAGLIAGAVVAVLLRRPRVQQPRTRGLASIAATEAPIASG